MAQQFALQHPKRVGKLVLAATAAGMVMVPGDPKVLAYYAEGMHVSPELAKEAFEIAARHDHVESMRALAVMYRAGLGTPVNEGKAISWDRRADRIERSDRRRGLVMDE